jgi:hypothetical protein
MRRALCEEEMGDMRRSAARRGKQLEEERLFFSNTYEEGSVQRGER